MSHAKSLMVLAGAAVSFTGIAVAQTTSPTVSRDEVRAIVSEMMSDAETRSTFQGGGTAGYDRNFFLASSDNKFRLEISGYTQIRYYAAFTDKDNTAIYGATSGNGGGGYTGGFNVRSTSVNFGGHIGSEDLHYDIRINQSNGGALTMDDIKFRYALGSGWFVRGGQYKVNYLKEENNAEVYTMAMERGVVNSAFNQGRSQGVGLAYMSDDVDGYFDFTDGFNSVNSNFNNDYTSTTNYFPAGATTTAAHNDYAFTGRLDWRFAGTREQLKDYTSRLGEGFGGQLGGALHYQQSANNNQAPTDYDTRAFGFTVDAQVESNGFSAFAAFVGQMTKFTSADPTFTQPQWDDFGVTAQVGWRFAENTEVFGKWDWVYLDKDHGTTDIKKNNNFLTFGVNQYLAGNAAKFTVDCIFGLNQTASGTGGNGHMSEETMPNGSSFATFTQNGGLQPTDKGASFTIRAQFQLMF